MPDLVYEFVTLKIQNEIQFNKLGIKKQTQQAQINQQIK